jgi:hypothetical protein
MNFPTAYEHALAGYPIGRTSWGSELDNGPARWITCEGGAWFDNTATSRNILVQGNSPSLTVGDYTGQDWVVACEDATQGTGISPQPNFPITPFVASHPSFDVYAPPGQVAA